MTIFDSIKHSQQLVEHIASHPEIAANAEITRVLASLKTELHAIDAHAQQLLTISSKSTSTEAKLDIKSGCYVFNNLKGYFCPSCYDNHGDKIATTRLNSKLRVCPKCRKSIK